LLNLTGDFGAGALGQRAELDQRIFADDTIARPGLYANQNRALVTLPAKGVG